MKYSETRQRVDDLFWEFARLVEGVQPRVFVGENVSGLVKGKSKGYFLDILRLLQGCGYVVRAKLLNAQWLGVPQARQRIIFVGVREDLDAEPAHPAPLPWCYSVADALPWLAEEGAQAVEDTGGEWAHGDITDRPCPTVRIAGGACHLFVDRTVEPESDISGYAIGREWDALEPGVYLKDRYYSLIKPKLDRPSPTVTQTGGITGAASVTHPTERRKFSIVELRRICGFPDDFKLTGSYKQQWERLGRAVPPVMAFWIAVAIREGVLFPLDGREPWEHDPACLTQGWQ